MKVTVRATVRVGVGVRVRVVVEVRVRVGVRVRVVVGVSGGKNPFTARESAIPNLNLVLFGDSHTKQKAIKSEWRYR